MTQYYMVKDGQRIGPHTIQELMKQGLGSATLVWRAGLTDWVAASQLPEVAALLTPPPPPVPPVPPVSPAPPMAQTPTPVEQTPSAQSQPEVTVAPSPSQAPAADTHYYAVVNGAEKGPLTLAQLGRAGIDGNSMIRIDGTSEHTAAANIPAVSDMLEARTQSPLYGTYTKLVSIVGANMLNVTNGKFILFDDYATVAPNVGMSVMMGNFSKSGYRRMHFGYEEIAAVVNGFMAKFSIRLTDGTVIRMSANGKKDLFAQIERRRAAWFERHGMPVPPLAAK